METITKIAIFRKKQIRRVIHQNEWWFVVEDVIATLIDSSDPKQYIQKMKQRDLELEKGWVQIVRTLSVDTVGGAQNMICANTEGIFRIIQSIPSPKAEPFKRWLAKVGYERVQEIENPELATKRTRLLYKLKGYPDSWIDIYLPKSSLFVGSRTYESNTDSRTKRTTYSLLERSRKRWRSLFCPTRGRVVLYSFSVTTRTSSN